LVGGGGGGVGLHPRGGAQRGRGGGEKGPELMSDGIGKKKQIPALGHEARGEKKGGSQKKKKEQELRKGNKRDVNSISARGGGTNSKRGENWSKG